MANIARLGVVMGLDTAEFTTGLKTVEKGLQELKYKLAEFASVAAFVEMTKSAMEYADTIVKTAKANDVTTESVLRLSKALEENGGNAEETGRIYSGFNQKVETAALGSAKAQESFARLGVSLNDIKTLSSQELFDKTIVGLSKIEDSVARNGLAFQTLGKAIRGVDIKGLADTLEETKGQMDRYAFAVEQAHALHLEMEASGRKVGLMFTEAIIPTLKVVYDDLTKAGGALDYLFAGFKYVFVGLAIYLEAAKTAIFYIIDTIKLFANVINDLLTLSIDRAIQHFKGGLAEIKNDADAYLKILQDLKKANTQGTPQQADNTQQNRDIIDALAKQLGVAQNLSKEYAAHAALQLQMVLQQRELLTLTNDQKIVQQAINKVIDDAQKSLDAIDKQIAAASGQGAAGQRLIAVYKEQQKEIKKIRDDYIQYTKEETQATIDFQRTFEFGWDHAFKQFAEDAFNNAKIAGDMFNSVMGTMNSAIDNFVKTGKLSFSDFAQSVIQDIEKIMLKALAAQAVSSIFGGGSGGGQGLLGALGGFVGGFFADGGTPPVGVPSVVGENGPELFVPKQSGTIIPNNQLSNALGSSGGGVTYNGPYIAQMSAIDTQSAVQFLASNKMGVWASYQSAAKSLPVSR
jgi:lambda family phage tail tape measure protein